VIALARQGTRLPVAREITRINSIYIYSFPIEKSQVVTIVNFLIDSGKYILFSLKWACKWTLFVSHLKGK
jgi:hypothetical protein